MSSYIPGIVLQKNNTFFIGLGGIAVEKSGGSQIVTGLGLATEVPTPDGGGVIDADYWAVPTNDNGIVTGYTYHPYNAGDPIGSVAPTVESFAVFRIMNRLASDYWWVVGTVAQYITAAGGGAALPTTITVLPAGCQRMCVFDANNHYFAVIGIPILTFNKRYFPHGDFNGIALPAGTATGYITTATLLTFLNTATTVTTTTVNGVPHTTYTGGWAIVGTWTVSADNQTLIATQTAGPGTDVLCAEIAAINPSL
jgi:hypothetical protein